MAHNIIYKRVGESNQFDMDFTDLLTSSGDASLTGASTVTAKDSSGAAAASVVGTVSVQTSTTLRAIVQAGADKEDYTLQFKGIGNVSGQIYIQVLEVRVRELIVGNV